MKGVISMSGRKIYSNELKLEIVQPYLKGDVSLKVLGLAFLLRLFCLQRLRW
jgi:transposase-like protein